LDIWLLTAPLDFPESHDAVEGPSDGVEIARVLDQLKASLDEDPTLGRSGLRVEYRGTDGNAAVKRSDSPPN
jgi:hypothetical protein